MKITRSIIRMKSVILKKEEEQLMSFMLAWFNGMVISFDEQK